MDKTHKFVPFQEEQNFQNDNFHRDSPLKYTNRLEYPDRKHHSTNKDYQSTELPLENTKQRNLQNEINIRSPIEMELERSMHHEEMRLHCDSFFKKIVLRCEYL